MFTDENKNLLSNIICPECSSFPLLGFNFDYENKNLSKSCELYSYCIFDHKKKKKYLTKKILDDIFINKDGNNRISNYLIKCEACNTKEIDYHCLDCKRNLCTECFKYHMKHEFYHNKIHMSDIELNEIKNKLA